MRIELETYYQRLIAERERLLRMIQLEEGERFELSSTTDKGDEADKSLIAHLREFNITRVELNRQRLQHVEEALERLAQDLYGYCIHCGELIAAKRLMAIPWARYCINCQELKEKGRLQETGSEDEE